MPEKKDKPAPAPEISMQEEGTETRRLIVDKRFLFVASRAANASPDVGEIAITRNGSTGQEPFRLLAKELDAMIAGLVRVRDEMVPRLRSYGEVES